MPRARALPSGAWPRKNLHLAPEMLHAPPANCSAHTVSKCRREPSRWEVLDVHAKCPAALNRRSAVLQGHHLA
eukprot:1920481-Alexandrium_andersonii.AAC.1